MSLVVSDNNNNNTLKPAAPIPFCVLIYCGYVPPFNDQDPKGNAECYGSELAARNVAWYFMNQIDNCQVHIFCSGEKKDEKQSQVADLDSRGVQFHDSTTFQEFQTQYFLQHGLPDVLIISRYIHFMLEFVSLAKKTFLWLHDVTANPYWSSNNNSTAFPNQGGPLLMNTLSMINGVVTVSNTHRNAVINNWLNGSGHYVLGSEQAKKFKAIGNALEPARFQNNNITRIKNRFIYCSNPDRGLENALDVFERIQKTVPDATFYIFYRQPDDHLVNRIASMSGVHIMGKVSQERLAEELQKSDVWLYPCNFYETYCMSALEAQAAGCICVSVPLGALEEILGDSRGVLIPGDANTVQWTDQAVQEVTKILSFSEEEKMMRYRTRSRAWALQQTWDNVGNQWLELIS